MVTCSPTVTWGPALSVWSLWTAIRDKLWQDLTETSEQSQDVLFIPRLLVTILQVRLILCWEVLLGTCPTFHQEYDLHHTILWPCQVILRQDLQVAIHHHQDLPFLL